MDRYINLIDLKRSTPYLLATTARDHSAVETAVLLLIEMQKLD